jgi:hypothetical protein
MKLFLKLLLLGLIVSVQEDVDQYEVLIQEEVNNTYCEQVIENMVSVIEKAYVFSDFIKSPIQPEGYEDYIPKVDLVAELRNISKENRKFYDFYREVQGVLEKARDGHFSIYAQNSPNNFPLSSSYFCVPFKYYIEEKFDENNNVTDKYLSIDYKDSCEENYDESLLNKIKQLKGEKIESINGIDPYKYLEELGKKGMVIRSPQARYILLLWYYSNFYLHRHPFKKEELQLSIKFDGKEESLDLEYKFHQKQFFSSEFKEFFLAEQEKHLRLNMPIPDFEQLELQFKIKKGLISKDNLIKDEKDIWDLKSDDGSIKCKVDKINELNVFYQNSFYPFEEQFYNYETVMYECFKRFYNNAYKTIIIEDKNGGGYSELCIPFTQYNRPKILKSCVSSNKATEITYEDFFNNDENVNIDTCLAYTENDNILDGPIDQYSEKVSHKRTKPYENLNVYEKKIMEKKRLEYLEYGNSKKPTEIIIFTDGFSFSCTSVFIRGMQIQGAAIIAGYNIRPDLVDTKVDASQSNSPVGSFSFYEPVKNLNDLGYSLGITVAEHFDPNDNREPKIPMEFSIYPVDTVVDIYKPYSDSIYDRFVKEAKQIFNKYNNIEGECNPDNKYLYFETEECDSKLNIDHAHGGYLCGNDSKWNKTNCIAAYCDKDYILNDERTECIKNPCDNLILNEISINGENTTTFDIKPKNIYIFKIENNNNISYIFSSDYKEKLFYIYNEDHILESVNNGTNFINKDKIYVNFYTNITETIQIQIEPIKNNDDDDDEKDDKKEGLSKTALALIIVGSIIVVIIIILVLVIIISKNKRMKDSEIEEKTQSLTSI